MKKIIIGVCLGLMIGLNMNNILIGTMKVIDNIGYMTGACVVEEIEALTDIYYELGYK